MKTPAYLGPEVWLVIFKHMSCMPLAHRKSFETAPKNFQSSLAACCRVSKLFHHLAATQLYIHPIVRSLSLFIAGLTDPAVAGLISKAELLARTRILYLEDPSDAHFPHPTPDTPDEVAEAYAASDSDTEEDRDGAKRIDQMRQLLRAAQDLQKAWRIILDKPNAPSRIFPRLSAVALCAIYGSGWLPHPARSEPWASIHHANQEALHDFLNSTPSIRHFCQDGGFGLLSLENRFFFWDPKRDITISTHSSIYDPHTRPICIGARINWIVHPDGAILDNLYHPTVFSLAEYDMGRLLGSRRRLIRDEGYADITSWGVDVGLYTDRDADGEERKDLREWAVHQTEQWMEKLTESRESFPRGLAVRDNFEVVPLSEGFCAACGWTGENAARPSGLE